MSEYVYVFDLGLVGALLGDADLKRWERQSGRTIVVSFDGRRSIAELTAGALRIHVDRLGIGYVAASTVLSRTESEYVRRMVFSLWPACRWKPGRSPWRRFDRRPVSSDPQTIGYGMIRMLGDECRELVDHAERTYRFRSTRDLHCQRIRLKAFRHSPLLREVSLDDYGLFDMLDRCRDRLDFVFFSSDRMTEKAFLMTAVIGAASTILPVSRILQGEPSADFTALRIITVIMLILLAAFMIRRKP